VTRPIRLHDAARREAVNAARWYARYAGMSLAREFFSAVDSTLASIGEHPEARPLAHDAPPSVEARQAALHRRFPYRVVFVARTTDVYVLAVAHKRRRPGYWTRRFPAR
jgi:plasmid stabilization system protein ParE